MDKICITCRNQNNSNYIHQCRKCYYQEYISKLDSKKCFTCSKEFKAEGINCSSCARKLRLKNQPPISCSNCMRDNVLIIRKKLNLCVTCWRKKQEEEIPGYKEKRILYNRQSHRKYRGKNPIGPLQRKPSGEGHINKMGYKIITKVGHPNSNSMKGAIPEHIFVMSEHLGRQLFKGESVHHKNGIRDDNRIQNLELWNKAQPAGQRVHDKIKWAKEFLEQYGYKIT